MMLMEYLVCILTFFAIQLVGIEKGETYTYKQGCCLHGMSLIQDLCTARVMPFLLMLICVFVIRYAGWCIGGDDIFCHFIFSIIFTHY